MIERYEEYLKYELNYSNYTIKEYIIHVKEFLFYCDENKIDYLNINKDIIIDYLKKIDNLSNKSISAILSSLRCFYNYLLDNKMIEVNYNAISELPNEEKLIKEVVIRVLEEEKVLPEVDVYITLTNNEEIHKINKEYRDVDRPTDVLSFPMYERDEIAGLKNDTDDEIEKILGDIIVSIEKVREQAEEYGHSFERELAYLVTHGMLHLLGYDHMIEEEKAVMRKREEEILETLNITR